MIRAILNFLGGGVLDRALSSVDRYVQSKTDQEAIKGEIIKEHYRQRADWMRAGGFWLMWIFAFPLAVWYGAVITYSILWCSKCAYPQTWTIAALPAPLDEWAGMMIIAIFGVVGVSRFRK